MATQSPRTKVLVVMSDPPLAAMRPRERLDVVLMALAFELEVSVAFVGTGVLQLLPPGAAGGETLPDHGAALGSLALYGIEAVYAEAAALHRHGIAADALRIPVRALDDAGLTALVHDQDLLL